MKKIKKAKNIKNDNRNKSIEKAREDLMMKKYLLIGAVAVTMAVGVLFSLTALRGDNETTTASVLINNSRRVAAVNQQTAETDFERCGKFKDVTPAMSSCALTRAMRDRNIFSGDANGNFRPNDPVSRAEFAKIISIALYGLNIKVEDSNGVRGENMGFRDLRGNHWAFPYIKIAKLKKLIGGYPDGTFGMDKLVTRAEFAKMLYSQISDISKKIAEATAFVKGNWRDPYTTLGFKEGQWYTDYLMMLIYADSKGKFLQECSDKGKICPERPITRIEIAAALISLNTTYDLPVGFGKDDKQVTGEISKDNCARIRRLSNITGILQDLGINKDVVTRCSNSPFGKDTDETMDLHPVAPKLPGDITEEITLANCEKIRALSNMTETLQNLGISTGIIRKCAQTYIDKWNPSAISSSVSYNNCQKIRDLNNMTATLQNLGIEISIMNRCATAYPDMW